jgi:hypothetical protein
MHRGFIPLALSGCLLATLAVAAPAQPPSAPETKGPKGPNGPNGPLSNLKQPIVFYVAKGAPGACGPGCSEWIAAEGTIDPAAEPRLWELLRKLGNDRKPPVYFHSPGGSVTAGLQLGRLMRARGLTVGVGWTLPSSCDRQDPGAPACDTLKHAGRELPAELDIGAGVCASSCSYAILGGTVRYIGVGARVGIHDAFPSPTKRTFDENGRIVDQPEVISPEVARAGLAQAYGVIAGYVNQMGVSVDLVKAAHSVPSSTVHMLTREELFAFGIDRRDTVEGGWSLLDQPWGVSAVKLIATREGNGASFRWAMLSLACRDARTVRLQYAYQVGARPESEPAAWRVTAGARSFALVRLGDTPPAEKQPRMESHDAELPIAALDAEAFLIEAVAMSSHDPSISAAPSAGLAVQGAAPAVAALARRCGSTR